MLAMQAFHGVRRSARGGPAENLPQALLCQQFKAQLRARRGPKVGSVSLSPRGDGRMPSDMQAGMWLDF